MMTTTMTNYNNDIGEYYANKYGFIFTEKAWLENKQELFMFANLVADATKEKAVKVCEERDKEYGSLNGQILAAAIRSME